VYERDLPRADNLILKLVWLRNVCNGILPHSRRGLLEKGNALVSKINSRRVTEPEGSLLWSYESDTRPYPEPDEPNLPLPVAARSKVWVCGRSLARIVCSNPVGGPRMSVSCECCVLSGRGLCIGLITRPEEPYRAWCVWVCSWSLVN